MSSWSSYLQGRQLLLCWNLVLEKNQFGNEARCRICCSLGATESRRVIIDSSQREWREAVALELSARLALNRTACISRQVSSARETEKTGACSRSRIDENRRFLLALMRITRWCFVDPAHPHAFNPLPSSLVPIFISMLVSNIVLNI